MKKICVIVGARPQFIKLAPLSKEIRKYHKEIIIHTGQHFDKEMSDLFFRELEIAEPDYNLNINSGLHGEQTGRMLIKLEEIILNIKPDLIVVFGDTNSTLAGALVGSKLNIPVAHIEAGLRSFNKTMPEEINRITTDHISDFLFVPSETALKNLKMENINSNIFLVGDLMYDSVLKNTKIAETKLDIMEKYSLVKKEYIFLTLHRPYNVDVKIVLNNILNALSKTGLKVIFPAHPRTIQRIKEFNINLSSNIKLIKPVGYLESLLLQKWAAKVVTDSGGIQKEAFFLNTLCITLRSETEWVETVDIGANILIKDRCFEGIKKALSTERIWNTDSIPYGDGNTARKIVDILVKVS